MATIAENLQILKDSTDAIKQAIIDKGGTVNGDISTWADAISGIGGISGELDLITFYLGSTYTSKICLRGMTWAEYVGSVFNTKDSQFGSVSINQYNQQMQCSYGYIMNPNTGTYSYPHETIYSQTYSIHQDSSGGSD